MLAKPTNRDYSLLLTWLSATLVGLLIYAPALQLPLFWDDAPQFRWLVPLSPFQVWYTGQISSFYRPLPFMLFKVLWLLQGKYDPLTLHAISVLVHTINAGFIGILARRLTHRRWIGPVAAVMFVAFPFAHQAVTWVTSLFHLVLVLGTLGAILLGLRYLDRGNRRALIGTWVVAFIAIFSHENGVILPILISAILLTIAYRENILHTSWRKLAWIIGPIALIAAIYMLIWLRVPKGTDLSQGLQWSALDAKIAYITQAATYPLSALLRPLIHDGSALLPTLIALSLITLIIALTITVRSRNWRIISLQAAPLLWIIVAAVPSVLLLTSPYLLGSPRLLYLVSVGVVLFWSVWLSQTLQSRYWRYIGGITLASFIGVGLIFGLHVMGRYQRMSDFYWSFIKSVEAQGNAPTLLINAPSYIAPREEKSTFLLGSEGATFLAFYLSLNDIVWLNTGHDYPVKAVGFDQTMTQPPDEVFYANQPWVTWDELTPELAAVQIVYSVRFMDRQFFPVRVGDKLDQPSGSLHAEYPNAILLDVYLEDNDHVLTLNWRSKTSTIATPFVHVICDGKLAAQFDGPPLAGIHPLDRWQAGEMWSDHRYIGQPCTKIESIAVGLYDPNTGERFKAQLPDGETVDTLSVPLGVKP